MHFVKQLKLSFLNIKNYAYIIVDEASKQAALVDPSWEFETITNTLNELEVKLTTILLTHSHYDHVNMVSPLLKRFNPQVFMSNKEIDFYNFKCERLNPVQHLDTIALGQTVITCLFTPGHTAGGVSFLLSDSLFTGDTIFIEGCGVCNGRGGCPEKMFDSIQNVKMTVPPHVTVYPGHSFGKEPGAPLENIMKENIYFQIEKKEQFVNLRMRKGQQNIYNFQ